jgi:hypothetical protein
MKREQLPEHIKKQCPKGLTEEQIEGFLLGWLAAMEEEGQRPIVVNPSPPVTIPIPYERPLPYYPQKFWWGEGTTADPHPGVVSVGTTFQAVGEIVEQN